MDRKREKEGGWIQCFMKNEDKSLTDVENVMYIIPMYLRLKTFSKNPPPNVISPIMFCYFYFALGLHDSAHCWSAHRPPAAHDSFKRVHD